MIVPLDEIAWLTNLRGKDIDYNPLFFSHAIVHKDGEVNKIALYINEAKTADVKEYLTEHHIEVFPYDQIYADVAAGGRFGATKMCVDEVNLRLYQSLVEENIVSTPDLLGEIKMVKNERQLRGYREC